MLISLFARTLRGKASVGSDAALRVRRSGPGLTYFFCLTGFCERLVAVCRALPETEVTGLDRSASGDALRPLMATRFLAALKFFRCTCQADFSANTIIKPLESE